MKKYREHLRHLKYLSLISIVMLISCHQNFSRLTKEENRYNLTTLSDRLFLEKDKRPLISHLQTQEELTEFIGKHLFERLPFYGKANHMLSVDTDSPELLALKIKDLV